MRTWYKKVESGILYSTCFSELINATTLSDIKHKNNYGNGYVVYDQIGTGSGAIVYRGIRYLDHKVHMAIKVQKKSTSRNKQIENEQAIHKSLDHPNIVALLDTFDDPLHYFIIMKYIKCDLYNDLDCEKSASTILNYTAHILAALSYCHANKIVHRDVKLENVLVDTNGGDANLLLCDFGHAIMFDQMQPTIINFGTRVYHSPELQDGEIYDETIDYWACGIIMLELIKKEPFNDRMSRNNKFDASGVLINTLLANDAAYTAAAQYLLNRDPAKRRGAATINLSS